MVGNWCASLKLMQYEELRAIDRQELERCLEAGPVEERAIGVLRMALHEGDLQWAIEVLGRTLRDEDAQVVIASIQAVGHVARKHEHFCVSLRVRLRELSRDPRYAGCVADTLEEIEVFGV